MAIAFLSARWSNLALITYALDPAILDPLLPPGCVADTIEGRAFVSLVAFDFLQTRVLGIPWPGFVNFPEVNLRFYVRDRAGADSRRGVTFVSELVPQRFVASVANRLYGEPYRAVPMSSRIESASSTITMLHTLKIDGREQLIRVVGKRPAIVPSSDSTDHFFKEHEWGFGFSRNRKRCITYRVVHDRWAVYPVESHELQYDFGANYGDRWAILNGALPYHVTFAVGSTVKIYPWRSRSTND